MGDGAGNTYCGKQPSRIGSPSFHGVRLGILALAFLAAWTVPGAGMAFQLRGDRLYALGTIAEGDAYAFEAAMSRVPRDEMGDPMATVVLDSPGGSLFEGLRLGEAIRREGIPTLVEAGHGCYSACAVAFLGGKFSGVAADAVGRQLEPGASLGFHGYSLPGERVELANETLDGARLVNSIIQEYASRMGEVDAGQLSRLLGTPPSAMEIVDTPREIRALGVTLAGDPPKPPKGWAVAACKVAVAELLSPLDRLGLESRVPGPPEPMKDLASFRTRLLDEKYPDEPANAGVRKAVLSLPPATGLDLLAGTALYADRDRIGAWRVQLERGAGFYHDACYAVTDFTIINTLVVDSVSPGAVVRTYGTLAGFPADDPLW